MSAFEEEHALLLAELRRGALHAPDSLRSRVLANAPAARRTRAFRRPPRRLVLVAVPLALAAAVTAAVVHGVVGSSSSALAPVYGERENQRLFSIGTTPAAAAPARKELHGSSGSSTSDSVAGALVQSNGAQYNISAAGTNVESKLRPSPGIPVPTTNRLVHADAQLSVAEDGAANLSSATTRATQIVSALGGYAQSVQYRTAHDGSGSAFLDLRVPVGNVQKAVNRLAALGTVVNEQVETQDLEQQLTRQTNTIVSLRRTIAAYEKALQNPYLPASQRVIMQIRLSNAKRSLTQMRQARGGTISSAATADVSLTLTTQHGIAAIHTKRGRLGRMFHGAVGFLGLEGIIVLYALVVLSPILLIGGLGWALWRERRRREERRLLAA